MSQRSGYKEQKEQGDSLSINERLICYHVENSNRLSLGQAPVTGIDVVMEPGIW